MGKIFEEFYLVNEGDDEVVIECNNSAFNHQFVFEKLTATSGLFTPKILLNGASEYIAIQKDGSDLIVNIATMTNPWSIIYLGFIVASKLDFTTLNGSAKFTLSSGS